MKTKFRESNKITMVSIFLNIFLTIIKILSGIIGNSSVIIVDGLHSASDIITSLGILIGNSISMKPKDKEHPYGHEKAETIVSLILSSVLIIIALNIGFNGLKSLFNIDNLSIPSAFPLIVAVISIIIKEYQFQITIKVAKKINSMSLRADAWHHRSDALSSIAAFIGIAGAILGFPIFDSISTIIVALIVVYVGYDIFKSSCDELMDRSISLNDINKIELIGKKTKGVYKIREIKSRKHGSMAYVDMCILIEKDKTLTEAHEIAHNLEKHIMDEINYIKEINIHTEPF